MDNNVCESKKISDKAFLQGLIISIVSILLCLTALCSMTFAWFNASTKSPSNLIESGKFDLDIKIYYLDEVNDLAVPVTVTEDGQCVLEKVGTYTVYLYIADGTTLEKGHCGISINGKPELLTESISTKTELGVIPPLTITVETALENVMITFAPKWGIPARSDILHNGTVSVEPNISGGNE